MPAIITLLTDFGAADTYVGTMKGVILGINPGAVIVDLTHEVQPQNIEQAAFLLKTTYRYFPSGTVHLVVVDPGVGTKRRPIAVRGGRWTFAAPDNGVLSPVIRAEAGFQAFEIADPRFMLPETSRTFHGRDIFAPAAAHLSLGVPISELGPPVPNPILLPPLAQPAGDILTGHVIHIDRFGNCITDIEEERFRWWARGSITIEAEGKPVRGPVATYADAAPGEAVTLFGSAGHLEIAVGMGSAAARFGITLGCQVSVMRGAG